MFVENDSFLSMLLENGCIVVLVKIRMNGFDEDYEGISNNGSVSFQEVDTSRFIKGKKLSSFNGGKYAFKREIRTKYFIR